MDCRGNTIAGWLDGSEDLLGLQSAKGFIEKEQNSGLLLFFLGLWNEQGNVKTFQ